MDDFFELDGEQVATIYKDGNEIGAVYMSVESEDEFGLDVWFETGDDSLYLDAATDDISLIHEVAFHLGCDPMDVVVR